MYRRLRRSRHQR